MEGKGKWIVLGVGCGCLFLLGLAAAGGAAFFFLGHRPSDEKVSVTPIAVPSAPAPPVSSPPEPTETTPAPPESAPPVAPATPEELPVPGGPPAAEATFTIENFRFLAPEKDEDNGGVYQKGEKIRYAYDISDLERDSGNRWSVRMDLTVTAPSGEKLIAKTMVDQDGDMDEPLPLSGYVDLPAQAPSGTYAFRAVTRDKLAGTEIVTDRTFEVQ